MNKHAVITSFHSYSTKIIEWEPPAVLSFDSHVDDSMIVEGKSPKVINRLPFADRSAFLRVCVHNTLAISAPNDSVHIVIPEGCFRSRIYGEWERIEKRDPIFDKYFEAKLEILEKVLHLKIFFSPPQNISYILKKVPKHTTVLDVDVDYFEEFQNSCYTKAPKFQYSDGSISKNGSLNDFYRAVKHIHPEKIIISEIKLSQIKKPTMSFSQMLEFLKNTGYSVEYDELVESDEIAEDALRKQETYKEWEESRLKTESLPISKQEMFDEIMRYDEERAELIKEYYGIKKKKT